MSKAFSKAGLERIIEAMRDPSANPNVDADAETLLYLLDPAGATYPPPTFSKDSVSSRFSTEDRFLTTRGLFELAFQVGYIQPSHLNPETIAELSRVFDELELRFPANQSPRPRSLLRSFQTFVGADLDQSAVKARQVGAFESFLQLTSEVWNDSDCRLFLDETYQSGDWPLDAAALISPAHFASAFSHGRVGQLAVPEIRGGFAALEYFDRFHSLVDEVKGLFDLRDRLILHAFWTHDANRIMRRIATWEACFLDWNPRPVEQEDSDPGVDLESVFGSLAALQEVSSLGQEIQTPPERMRAFPFYAAVSSAAIQIEPRGPSWKNELGSARETALTARRTLEDVAPIMAEVPSLWMRPFEIFTDACARLADLGDHDTAAALVAPFLDWTTATLGPGGSGPAEQVAVQIVDKARNVVRVNAGSSVSTSYSPMFEPIVEASEAVRLPSQVQLPEPG